ncbi:MAG: ABC transporter permease [Bacillota bacterium]
MNETATVPVKTGSSANYDRLDTLVRKFERIFNFFVPVAAILLALIVVGIIITAQGASPFEAYAALFDSAFVGSYNIANTLNTATPLLLTGLGIALAARAGIINLGGEGQIIMGGIFATMAATSFPGIPAFLHIPVTLMAGFFGGMLWAAVPGYFFAKHGTNFMIVTILLNDIAGGIINYLVKGPMVEPPGYTPQSYLIADTARLPVILDGTRLYPGILIALVLAFAAYVLIYRTSFGHDLRALGENPVVARHSGVNIFGMQILIVLLAGGLAGMAGASEIMGSQYRLRAGFLANYGYESLAVCMLGQKHPLGVVIAAIMFGALKAGRGGMVRAANLPTSLSLVLSGVIIFFVAVSPALMKLPRYLAVREMSRRQGAAKEVA